MLEPYDAKVSCPVLRGLTPLDIKKMRAGNHIIRIVLSIVIGTFLTYKNAMFKYESFIFDFIIFIILTIIGIIIWGWIVYIDLKIFKNSKQRKYFLTVLIGLIFITSNSIVSHKINSDFDKLTLLKVFYDGDYNGTAIDFKTDGTYIFDNSAIGCSSYKYGKYRIVENKIELDKETLDGVVFTNTLKIMTIETEYTEETKKENYLFQINKNGQVLKNETKFRVVIDNRNK